MVMCVSGRSVASGPRGREQGAPALQASILAIDIRPRTRLNKIFILIYCQAVNQLANQLGLDT